MKIFSELIRKHTDILLEGLSNAKIATIDHLDLNKEAIKLAQAEWRELKHKVEHNPSL